VPGAPGVAAFVADSVGVEGVAVPSGDVGVVDAPSAGVCPGVDGDVCVASVAVPGVPGLSAVDPSGAGFDASFVIEANPPANDPGRPRYHHTPTAANAVSSTSAASPTNAVPAPRRARATGTPGSTRSLAVHDDGCVSDTRGRACPA
jgi:hypothetical protein